MSSGAACCGERVYTLPNDPQAAGIARAFAATQSGFLSVAVRDDLLLLVTEIVTNAVRHGRPVFTLRMTLDTPSMRVAVHDHGLDLVPRRVGPVALDRANGRGLMIVSTLADSWGVDTDTIIGKSVWFELSR